MMESRWAPLRCLLIGAALLGWAHLACARGPGSATLRPIPREKAPFRGYSAQGRVVEGELQETWAPSSFWTGEYRPADEEFPVSLGRSLPYPNPYSHRVVAITLTSPADFDVSVLGPDKVEFDRFAFRGVEAGAYLFHLNKPVCPWEYATINLSIESVVVGEITIATKFLHGWK